MSVEALSAALSGIQAASTRQAASAHNVANLTSDEFRPLRVTQAERAGGGTRARVQRTPQPEEVDLARESVEQIRARVQLEASVGVIRAEAETKGSLVDLLG